KDIFRQFVARGGTVLMSTHTLEVAEAMCDRVAILQHGRIVAEGTVDDLRRQHRAGDASLEELFLKLTGGAHVRELAEVLGDGARCGSRGCGGGARRSGGTRGKGYARRASGARAGSSCRS